MQQATTVSLQMGFSRLQQGNPISPNPIEIKEETVEGLAGFEPATCGLGNRSAVLDRSVPKGIWRRSDSLPSSILMPGLCAQEWRRDLSLAGCGLVEGACATRPPSTPNANPQDVSVNSRRITTNPQPNKVVSSRSTQTSPF